MTRDIKDTKDTPTRVYRCIICLPRLAAHHSAPSFRFPDGAPACRLGRGGLISRLSKANPQPPDQCRHETFRGIFRVRCFMKHRSLARSVRHSLIVKEPERWAVTLIPNYVRTQYLLAKIFGIFQKVCKPDEPTIYGSAGNRFDQSTARHLARCDEDRGGWRLLALSIHDIRSHPAFFFPLHSPSGPRN